MSVVSGVDDTTRLALCTPKSSTSLFIFSPMFCSTARVVLETSIKFEACAISA
jgi:hypothetical protein